jgi:uncharacterized protein (UPF0216 family)
MENIKAGAFSSLNAIFSFSFDDKFFEMPLPMRRKTLADLQLAEISTVEDNAVTIKIGEKFVFDNKEIKMTFE